MRGFYLLLAIAYAHCVCGDDSDLASVILTPSNFDEEIKERNYLVAFFTPE